MREEQFKALFLSAGLRPGPRPSTCENDKVISIRRTRTDIRTKGKRRRRVTDKLAEVCFVFGFFSHCFSTEDLASRDLCVPVYMRKKKKKKKTSTTATKKKKKNPNVSVQTSTNVTRNPLATVFLWSPLSRLYRDCVEGMKRRSEQPGRG